ncbi:hypothetical protein LRB11_16195 [Ectothiorhodospira haloalkaliphila]|uniref:hypothetical protein n=1 Tax=Ectothiorhodospira haloalkaliphila TaxID=421628 RepID=UPI001EE7C165|nr:hypothetical protein [Ectothiorhodospira haloalkaliphila]MCG5526448.1 hypothetical protein [Ectothiorhodospira haloalkaliphila]
MSTAINRDVANGIWEVTYFLTSLYEYIDENKSLTSRGEDFGGYGKTTEEERSCTIIFGVRKPPKRGDVLQIGFYGYGEMNDAESSCIYILQWTDDAELWGRLKHEFSDPAHKIMETEEEWYIVPSWPHGKGASHEIIDAAAKEISDKIIKAILPDQV